MATVDVNPGVCGLLSRIKAEADEDQTVTFTVETTCPHIRAMADALESVDGYHEAFGKLGDGEIYKAAHAHCKHPACPVPSAFVKVLEVACGLALPRDVSMTLQKD
mgnify:CR=1 FL=1